MDEKKTEKVQNVILRHTCFNSRERGGERVNPPPRGFFWLKELGETKPPVAQRAGGIRKSHTKRKR